MRLGAAAPRSERSAPEQNTGPAPVRTIDAGLRRLPSRHASLRPTARGAAPRARCGCAASPGSGCERRRPAARRPTRPSRVRSVGGCPAEAGKWPVVSFGGDRDRRAPALPQDAAGPLRAGDRAARRQWEAARTFPAHDLFPKLAAVGLLGTRVRRGVRGHGCGPHLLHHRRRGDGSDQLRGGAHGHGRADVDGHAGPGPLRVARAEGAVSGARHQRRDGRPPSRSPSPTPAATSRASGPGRSATATSGSSTGRSSTSPTGPRRTGCASSPARPTIRGTRACRSSSSRRQLEGVVGLAQAREAGHVVQRHGRVLVHRRPGAGVQHHRRGRPGLPAADGAVPGRATHHLLQAGRFD